MGASVLEANSIEVLVLAGGLGTRLRSVVGELPKPLAPIGGIPFLQLQIEWLAAWGLNRFLVLAGYKFERMEEWLRSYSPQRISVRLVEETHPLGTGGAIIQALSSTDAEEILCLNGDTFFGINLESFLTQARVFTKVRPKAFVMAMKTAPAESNRYGKFDLEASGRVFMTHGAASKWINGGIYYFRRDALAHYPNGTKSLEDQIFPDLCTKECLFGVPVEGKFLDIGVPEDYLRAQSVLSEWMRV